MKRATRRQQVLIAIGTLAALLVVAWPVIRGPLLGRPPKLNGMTFEKVMLELAAPPFADGEAISAELTDGEAIARIAAAIQDATPTLAHRCAEIGSVTFFKPGGETIRVRILPGHDDMHMEYRFNGHFRMNRARFLEAMKPFEVEEWRFTEPHRRAAVPLDAAGS